MTKYVSSFFCIAVLILALVTTGCTSTPQQDPGPATAQGEDVPSAWHWRYNANWPRFGVIDTTVYPPRPDRSANIRQTEQALQKRISLKSKSDTFEAVLDFIHDQTGVNLAVNWAALELVGIEQTSRVSLRLDAVQASDVLILALQQVSADAFDDDKAHYMIDDNIVKISTRRDLKSETETRAYDITWFINPIGIMRAWLYHDDPRASVLAEILIGHDELINRIGTPAFNLGDAIGPNPNPSHTPRRKKHVQITTESEANWANNQIDAMIDEITFSVGDPDEWLDEESTVRAVKNALLIKTTSENHRQLEKLFYTIHQSQVRNYQEQAKTIEVYLLLADAEKLRLKQSYRKALATIEKALRVDPASPEALALKQVLTETMSR